MLNLVRVVFVCLLAQVAAPSFAQSAESTADPWEPFNRQMFRLNNQLDRFVMRPVASVYRTFVPNPVRDAVSRASRNLTEPGTSVNHLLQGEARESAKTAGRFLINSTLGVVGLFEVAESMGLEKTTQEDFGQTLGAWGVKSGPYLMLPLMGPSTLRDAGSAVTVDFRLDPPTYVTPTQDRVIISGTRVISLRSRLLATEESIKGDDPYLLLRDAWLSRRNYEVNNGEVEEAFGDGFDDFLD